MRTLWCGTQTYRGVLSVQNIVVCERYLITCTPIIRVREQRYILHEISNQKANWICHILCRNCLLQRVIEGKVKGGIEVTERRGRRRRKLVDDLKERRGYSHLKEEALDRSMWRACSEEALDLS